MMNEKILIESKNEYKKKMQKILCITGILILVSLLIGFVSEDNRVGLFCECILLLSVLVLIVCLIIFIYVKATKMVITDKRVYGIAGAGRRVDLPLDSISAVATRRLGGLAVATSSGRIIFRGFTNRDELHETISGLLIERQNSNAAAPVAPVVSQNNADELKKFKELLDCGVISQEEFDAKKKQLLGI